MHETTLNLLLHEAVLHIRTAPLLPDERTTLIYGSVEPDRARRPLAAGVLSRMDASEVEGGVKPLEGRGSLMVKSDPARRRSRRLQITPEGVKLLRGAVEVWYTEHTALEAICVRNSSTYVGTA
jgi:hypothetical protein